MLKEVLQVEMKTLGNNTKMYESIKLAGKSNYKLYTEYNTVMVVYSF